MSDADVAAATAAIGDAVGATAAAAETVEDAAVTVAGTAAAAPTFHFRERGAAAGRGFAD